MMHGQNHFTFWLINGDRLRVLKNTQLKGIFGHKGGRKWGEVGGNCIMRVFRNVTPHQMLTLARWSGRFGILCACSKYGRVADCTEGCGVENYRKWLLWGPTSIRKDNIKGDVEIICYRVVILHGQNHFKYSILFFICKNSWCLLKSKLQPFQWGWWHFFFWFHWEGQDVWHTKS